MWCIYAATYVLRQTAPVSILFFDHVKEKSMKDEEEINSHSQTVFWNISKKIFQICLYLVAMPVEWEYTEIV